MNESLAVKYRPSKFNEVVEQNITSSILSKQIELRKFKHAYLFAGCSGCGKTTIARIFANEINQGDGYPIEYDCASHNSVDDVRNIIEDAKLRAIDGAEYKIFILDECHMFTNAAWNAFLKGIEEPSEYTIYIFCTTEPNKIPETILNRLQRYNFGKISNNGIYNRLMYISGVEKFVVEPAAIDLITKISDGSMRDAITTLEQCSDLSINLTFESVKSVIGDLSVEVMLNLTNAIIQKDQKTIINIIEKMFNSGSDLKAFLTSYLSFVLDLTKYLHFRNIDLTNIPKYLESQARTTVCSCGDGFEPAIKYFNELSEELLEIKSRIRLDNSYKNTIIISLIKFSRK